MTTIDLSSLSSTGSTASASQTDAQKKLAAAMAKLVKDETAKASQDTIKLDEQSVQTAQLAVTSEQKEKADKTAGDDKSKDTDKLFGAAAIKHGIFAQAERVKANQAKAASYGASNQPTQSNDSSNDPGAIANAKVDTYL